MPDLSRFSGVFPALVTPLDDSEELDSPAWRDLIAAVLDSGVNGIVVLGTAGEGAHVSPSTRARAIQEAVEFVGGRVPVVVGTCGLSTRETLQQNRQAAELGTDAVLVVPPYYSPLPPAQVKAFYVRIADSSRIPVFIYHIPQRTQVTMKPDLIVRLSHHPNIAGIKDSSGDMIAFAQVLFRTEASEFRVFQGRAPLVLASLALGAHGSITPVANVDSRAEVELHAAWQSGRLEDARQLQDRLIRLAQIFGYGEVPIASNIKAVLSMRGHCRNVVVSPFPAITGDALESLHKRMEELGLGDVVRRG